MRRLFPHQKDMLAYALRLAHPAYFAEMRLMKSAPMIRAAKLRSGRKRRVLIVAPFSALESWAEELPLEDEASIVHLSGTRKQRLDALRRPGAWFLLNHQGWRSIPEIAGRRQCEACGGQGRLRATRGLEVVNKHDVGDDYDVDITRRGPWGNPYRIGPDGSRQDVIALYRAYLLTHPDLMKRLPELANKRLGCVCAPRACHGDVLKELVRQNVGSRYCTECKGTGYGPVVERSGWTDVVLDESFIRNPQTRITRFFLSSFRDVPHRWMLTGLPNPESRLDYFNQLAWLDGGAFGCRSYWQFRAEYFEPRAYGYGWRPKRGAARAIDEMVGQRAFVLTRQAAGIPSRKVYEKRVLDFPTVVRKAYDDAERAFVRQRADGSTQETSFAGARWQWMHAFCGGFVDGKLVWPGKVNELTAILKGELAREQVVVWFAHTAELEACASALKKAKIPAVTYYGKTKIPVRSEARRSFERGRVRVFLAQESLGKTSLRLGAADTAIYYSNRGDFDSRSQSEARIDLVTKKVPLLYLDILVRDTIDVDLRDALRDKRWRSEASRHRAILKRMEERQKRAS